MTAFVDGEKDQHKTAEEEGGPGPIHGHVRMRRLAANTGWDGQNSCDEGKEEQHRPYSKVPAPVEKLSGHSGDENPRDKANGGAGTVHTENQVFAPSREMSSAQEHDSRRKQSRRAEALQCPTEIHHGGVLRETGNERLDKTPGQPPFEHHKSSKAIRQMAEEEQRTTRRQGKGTRWPAG
ncbi:hypothetical protein ABHI18_000018 [Aspergillus niger]